MSATILEALPLGQKVEHRLFRRFRYLNSTVMDAARGSALCVHRKFRSAG